jgi:hypothetical protein
MKHNPKFIYPKSIRSLIDDKRHYEIGTTKLPSVTTILSATMPEEKRKSLDAWKLRVGATEAQKVVTTAANRGTALHTILEHYITGQGYLDLTDVGKNAHSMAQTVFEKGMKDKISEYYATEATLFYPDLYAGATDMVAIHMTDRTVLLTLNNRINRSAESGSRITVCNYQPMQWHTIQFMEQIFKKELS